MVHDVRASPSSYLPAEDLATYVGKGNSQVPLRTPSKLLQDPPSSTQNLDSFAPSANSKCDTVCLQGQDVHKGAPPSCSSNQHQHHKDQEGTWSPLQGSGEGGDKPGDEVRVGHGEQEGRLAGLKVRMLQGSRLSRREGSVCSRKDGGDEARPGPGRGKVHSEDRWKVEGVLGLSREPCHGLKGPSRLLAPYCFLFLKSTRRNLRVSPKSFLT